MEFKTWIEVSFERMEILKALELPDVFTTDPGAGRIRAVYQSEIGFAALNHWNKQHPTLAILPTSRPVVSFHPNVHVVPYSDHSSYQELEDFISALKPTSLVPIVGNHAPGNLSALLPSKKRPEILVPESVRQYMLRQPELQLGSSAFTRLRSRHLRPVAPKGVIFESPPKGSTTPCEEDVCGPECLEQDASEEEMDTESEKDSESILIDIRKKVTPNKNRGGAGDTWSLNIVQTVSEDVLVAESLPLCQHTQSNHAPVEMVTNRRPLETNAKIMNIASSGNYNSQQRGHGNVENNHQPSDEDGMSQHSGCGSDWDSLTLLQNSTSNVSCTSCRTELKEKYLEEFENIILKSLPFMEEDFKPCGLLQHSFVHGFPFPLYDA